MENLWGNESAGNKLAKYLVTAKVGSWLQSWGFQVWGTHLGRTCNQKIIDQGTTTEVAGPEWTEQLKKNIEKQLTCSHLV